MAEEGRSPRLLQRPLVLLHGRPVSCLAAALTAENSLCFYLCFPTAQPRSGQYWELFDRWLDWPPGTEGMNDSRKSARHGPRRTQVVGKKRQHPKSSGQVHGFIS